MAKSGRSCLSSPGAETLDRNSGVQTGGELTTRHLVAFLPMRLSGWKPGPWGPLRPMSEAASPVASRCLQRKPGGTDWVPCATDPGGMAALWTWL